MGNCIMTIREMYGHLYLLLRLYFQVAVYCVYSEILGRCQYRLDAVTGQLFNHQFFIVSKLFGNGFYVDAFNIFGRLFAKGL